MITIRCQNCGKVLGAAYDPCRCPITITTSSTIANSSGMWMSPDFNKPMNLVDDDPPPGILADLPAMQERAELVHARPPHKDLDGPTARLLAMDVLALCEALKEAYPDEP